METTVFGVRTPVPARLRSVLAVSSLVILFGAWAAGSASGFVDPAFLPSPLKVLDGIVKLLVDHGLLKAVGVSALRILVATVLAIAVAFPLGVLMGTFEAVNRFFETILNPLRYMPITAFIPLLILWFGIDESQKIAFLFLGTFVFLYPVVIDAIRAVPEDLIATAQTLGASKRQIIFTVLIPAALPQIFDSFRNLNALAWGYVILAEIVNARNGIGYMLNLASKHLRVEWTLGGIIVIGVIGYLSDRVILALTQRLFKWRS